MKKIKQGDGSIFPVFDRWEIEAHHEFEDVEVPVYEKYRYLTVNPQLTHLVVKLKRCKHCSQVFLQDV